MQKKTLSMAVLLLFLAGCSEKKEENAKTAQSTETAKTTAVAKISALRIWRKCVCVHWLASRKNTRWRD